ncbi:hypothetical protein PBRA_006225 [Plasmodiophora brassicae]|uniref:Histone RNA hairpin-binding protein RNA-binding domain-containing protein n=1 Tax=Plasmodiophora brassicae TaxID=37360 RepID=A0A0G4ISP2_PLABS|nr:hypothetical protein PBRA_006225 [Plasmodiophora brassicae]
MPEHEPSCSSVTGGARVSPCASDTIGKPVRHRETDRTRLRQRQKQVDIGRNTIAYDRYVKSVAKDREKRYSTHPVTPDIHQVCSKRSFDGQVRKWRRLLHLWDTTTPGQSDEHAPVPGAGSADADDPEDDELVTIVYDKTCRDASVDSRPNDLRVDESDGSSVEF